MEIETFVHKPTGEFESTDPWQVGKKFRIIKVSPPVLSGGGMSAGWGVPNIGKEGVIISLEQREWCPLPHVRVDVGGDKDLVIEKEIIELIDD